MSSIDEKAEFQSEKLPNYVRELSAPPGAAYQPENTLQNFANAVRVHPAYQLPTFQQVSSIFMAINHSC